MNDKIDMVMLADKIALNYSRKAMPNEYYLPPLTLDELNLIGAALRAAPNSQSITEAQALDLLKAEILKFGSQRKWCKEYLISNQYVSDILTGKVGIGKSVQAALGIRRVIMYEKVENEK